MNRLNPSRFRFVWSLQWHSWCEQWNCRGPRPAPSFVPVRVVPDPIVELILPAGVHLRVPLAADAGQVARLVHALGVRPC